MTDIRTEAIFWSIILSMIGFTLLFPPFSLLWRLLAFFATGRFF